MTSINSTDNNQKFYSFLKLHDIKEADTNNDGAVSKSEFRKFLSNNDFDFSDLDGWNGETKTENDIINTFWKSINTNTENKKISKDSRVKNSAALDENELKAVGKRIEASEILDEFISNLELPSFLSDEYGCRKEIQEKLMKLVETNIIKPNESLENNIDTLLEKNVNRIKNEVVAEIYSSEYMLEALGNVTKEYDYKYADDAIFKKMVQDLLKQVKADNDESEIQQAIQDLVNGYLATAGIGDGIIPEGKRAAKAKKTEGEEGTEETKQTEEDKGLDINKAWYTPTNSSKLNDLQKAVLEKNLRTNINNSIKSEQNYEAYKNLYDEAIDDYIADMLKNTKNGDFNVAKTYGVSEFLSSDIGVKLTKTVTVEKNFDIEKGDEVYLMLSDICSAIAERFAKGSHELSICKEIKADILERVLAGEFDKDGVIDEAAIQKEIVKQTKANLAKFFPTGYGSLKLTEMNQLYNAMLDSANEQPGDEAKTKARKEAAINYCEAMAGKNEKFRKVVQSYFTENFKTFIENSLTQDIDETMSRLQAALKELGDAQELKEYFNNSTWDVIPNGGTIAMGSKGSTSFQLNPSFSTTRINDTSRFTYAPANGNISVDSTGKVTINGSEQASYSEDIIIYLDGVEIARKTITVQRTADKIDLTKVNAGLNGSTMDSILNNNDNHFTLSANVYGGKDNGFTNVKGPGGFFGTRETGSKIVAKAGMQGLIDAIKNSLVQTNPNDNYFTERLEKAAQDTLLYFSAIIDAISNDYNAGSTSAMNATRAFNFSYVDSDGNSYNETNTYLNNTYSDESDVNGRWNTNTAGTGISVNVSYSGTDTAQWTINTSVVLQKFQYFFNKGLY